MQERPNRGQGMEQHPARWRACAATPPPTLRRTALLALGCNAVLEASRLIAVDGQPWRFKTPTYPVMFLLGAAVIWLVVGVVHAVLGRFRRTAALVLSATAAVAVADHAKVRLRHEPLLPSDAAFVGDLDLVAGMVGPGLVLALVLTTAIVAAVVLLAARFATRRLPMQDHRLSGRSRLALRLGVAALCLVSLGHLAGFNSPGNAARGAFDTLGAQWRPWSQQRNYLGNGFVGGFLYNLDVPVAQSPPGYDRETMRRIARRYAEAAARMNRTRSGSLRGVNVVLMLSESFTDPLALDGVRLGTDPIPFTRRLMGTTTSGTMLAGAVGGGTANMEFEALTSMSMSQLPPQLTSPYQMLLPQQASFPSAVRWFRQTGHRAVALHPFTTEMYRRRDVYRVLGFDEFVHAGSMHRTDRSGDGGYISDAAAFDELELLVRDTAEPVFVNVVTMQNHMPYPGRYDDPVAVVGPAGRPLPEIGQYARGLRHTDRALARLLRRLTRLEEPTLLVFYGDHLPGSYPDDVFAANGRAAMHQTPFFVWANFPGPSEPQPVTSPIHFMDLAFERADAPVPPYYALLHRLRQRLPAMDSGMWFGPDGGRLRPSALPAATRRLLRDYGLVQYDLAWGRRYSAAALFGSRRGPAD